MAKCPHCESILEWLPDEDCYYCYYCDDFYDEDDLDD